MRCARNRRNGPRFDLLSWPPLLLSLLWSPPQRPPPQHFRLSICIAPRTAVDATTRLRRFSTPPQEKEDAEAEDRRKRGLAAAGHCDACGKALVAKKAFSRFEFRYCSSDCANLHKRKLAADAAERRFNGGGAGVGQK